uniref:Deacetylase sirtuin-type domain-containing protein n=1 Tax=Lotharella oceanica TaxID=641309 RepID=A0A7S2TS38_9EUKA|mmetsp:Transcript_24548/g.45902  ORF Transcript_24548/g.45902 Transcript_24548/m.45902 type:complete len:206 (+) Transcript_24548:3-620(+)
MSVKGSLSLFPFPEIESTKKNKARVVKCPLCKKSPLRPSILFFDESYNEEIYKAGSAMKAVEEADLMLMAGTMAYTNLPAKLIGSAARREIDVIDINPHANDKIKNAPLLQLLAKAEDIFPVIVERVGAELSSGKAKKENRKQDSKSKFIAETKSLSPSKTRIPGRQRKDFEGSNRRRVVQSTARETVGGRRLGPNALACAASSA